MTSRTPSLTPPPKPLACQLCERAEPLTRHHLIPRALHNKPRYRKRYSREQRLSAVVWLCVPCHRHLHRLYDEPVLADRLNHLKALQQDPEMAQFVDWLKDKPVGFKPKPSRRRRRG